MLHDIPETFPVTRLNSNVLFTVIWQWYLYCNQRGAGIYLWQHITINPTSALNTGLRMSTHALYIFSSCRNLYTWLGALWILYYRIIERTIYTVPITLSMNCQKKAQCLISFGVKCSRALQGGKNIRAETGICIMYGFSYPTMKLLCLQFPALHEGLDTADYALWIIPCQKCVPRLCPLICRSNSNPKPQWPTPF